MSKDRIYSTQDVQLNNRSHDASHKELDSCLIQLLRSDQQLIRQLRNDRALKPDFDACAELAATFRAKRNSVRDLCAVVVRCVWLRRACLLPVASVLTGVLLILALVLMEVQPIVYQTAAGERRAVVLPDSSILILNTGTLVSVDYGERARHLNIAWGEALFEVAPNKDAPFEVQAGGGVVTAAGTEFSVVVESDAVVVSVLEGIVSVKHTLADRVRSLSQGESLTYWQNGKVGEIVAADLGRIEAWRTGKAVFRTLRLAQAVAEHNRYSHRKIVIGSDHIQNRRVSGAFKVGDTEALIFLLENAMGLFVQRQGETIVLTDPAASTAKM